MRGRKPASMKTEGLSKLPSPPKWLPKEAKAEWKRVAPGLEARAVIATTDLGSLENYCLAIGQVHACQVELAKGEMFVSSERSAPRPHPAFRLMHEAMRQARQLAAELGLTPISRARPALAPQGNEDDFAGMDI